MRRLKASEGRSLCAKCGHKWVNHLKPWGLEAGPCTYHSGCVDMDCECPTYTPEVQV